MTLVSATLDTPLGPLLALHQDAVLCGLEFRDQEARCERLLHRLEARFGAARSAPERAERGLRVALEAYFDGQVGALGALPVRTWGTPFQERVWAMLRAIPPGETRTYAMLGPARAVGSANGRNPISLVIPCHRVIASGGQLGGYGGGLDRKAWLLAHEARCASRARVPDAARAAGTGGPATGRPQPACFSAAAFRSRPGTSACSGGTDPRARRT